MYISYSTTNSTNVKLTKILFYFQLILKFNINKYSDFD